MELMDVSELNEQTKGTLLYLLVFFGVLQVKGEFVENKEYMHKVEHSWVFLSHTIDKRCSMFWSLFEVLEVKDVLYRVCRNIPEEVGHG